MARILVRLIAATLCALAAITAPLGAQTLQRLTVTQVTLGSDNASPKVEAPFHLIVTVHVKQRVLDFTNVDLPVLAQLELLGDERRVTASASGTTYREVITVVAHHTGDVQIAPATIDAIDPRDGSPKRYYSNSLTLHVTGNPIDEVRAAASVARSVMRAIVTALFWLVCFAAAVFVAVTIYRRRKRVAAFIPPAPVAAEPVPLARDPRDVLRDGLLTLRAERTRAAAVGVRTIAHGIVGASDTETLGDVLRRPGAHDARMRQVLRTLERAAFTYDSDLPAAVDAAIVSLEHATL